MTPSPPAPPVFACILAGGSGTRFWPASTPRHPKQLLPLASDRPLIEETVARAELLTGPDRIRILAGSDLTPRLAAALPDLPASAFRIEPRAMGTGPVLAWAAHSALLEDPDAVLVSLHADHRIAPDEAFRATIGDAVRVAIESDLLVTIGVPPVRPETGYGYLFPGEALAGAVGDPPARRVAGFVEKPDPEQAEALVREGYRWNTGIFVWRAARFLEEVRAHSPEIGPYLPLLDTGDPEAFFRAVQPIAVDHAVLERSNRVACVDARFEWDDVGSWESLSRTLAPDARGNVGSGAVRIVEGENNIVWSDAGAVVLWGVSGLVAVRAGDIVLVFPRDRAPDLKSLVSGLPEELRNP